MHDGGILCGGWELVHSCGEAVNDVTSGGMLFSNTAETVVDDASKVAGATR